MALAQISSTGKKRARIIDEPARLHYVRMAIDESCVDMPVEQAILVIDTFKSGMTPIPGHGDSAQVYAAYQNALTKHNMMDFADIIRVAVFGMRNGEIPILPIKWLLVDEAQDMDEVQYAWIMSHNIRNIAVGFRVILSSNGSGV